MCINGRLCTYLNACTRNVTVTLGAAVTQDDRREAQPQNWAGRKRSEASVEQHRRNRERTRDSESLRAMRCGSCVRWCRSSTAIR